KEREEGRGKREGGGKKGKEGKEKERKEGEGGGGGRGGKRGKGAGFHQGKFNPVFRGVDY
ncbi:MAG: hypothetical protein ACKOZV_05005, partial [Bacteroidota bacterium]